ncbi:biotin/lipoyl attachment domain-containing protein [Anaeromyxobacter sp. K]|uniref:ATP-binding protein n=1 Tax=Anaeromyxobacter sp. (strain K) TaxID=447217 RepID=UPI00015F9F47|nr:biotin/lipoyl-containing protein [Anaeromyxobacter sp. K]ACG71736.1 biotin/lipoyl attachment domain-containing protein [Anaeromyxobacter sp. K]
MASNVDHYRNNPLIHRDRRLGSSPSAWVRSFACEDLKPLIVCRGPIRKEAMDVFAEMGITHVGILLSEKDSIVYANALAPELRQLANHDRVHRVPDYTGATKEERVERMNQIVQIALDNGYDSIFAGYGFMAEDEEFVATIERAGLKFIGPNSITQARAGKKDEAKRTALEVKVSVTPGVNDVAARTLLAKHRTRKQLLALVEAEGLACDAKVLADEKVELPVLAEHVLQASYARGLDLFTIDELGAQVQVEVAEMFRKYPRSRVRLKAIGGGGGKGQRILGASLLTAKDADDKAVAAAAAEAPAMVREVLSEVKATGVGDNKNVLIELNIEQTRHNEIQLLGNGEWCVSLGGRDCSLQMHEQKLLEVSVTQEALAATIARAANNGKTARAKALAVDLEILKRMEDDAARFGQAVGLDSASTFECIVDRDRYYFMEVNTRIQVEHRVSELCYSLEFANPDDPSDTFVVESLVEAMALLARHKKRLPKPRRIPRFGAAVEARLNATDASLSPHAGGVIRYWSKPIEGEIRDDQGISMPNPDTRMFMRYKVAGAYDSNIALLLTKGDRRLESYKHMARVLARMELRGTTLATNMEFHYGLVNWFLGQSVNAKPTTRFVVPYLTLVGMLKDEANKLDTAYAFAEMKKHYAKLMATENPGDAAAQKAMTDVLDRKVTLLTRVIDRFLDDPHLFAGWLSMNRRHYRIENGKLLWIRNPLGVLNDAYAYLNMAFHPRRPASQVMWEHDHELLTKSLRFYVALRERFGLKREEYYKLNEILQKEEPQDGFDAETWTKIRSAHLGYEAGNELLGLLFMVAESVRFFDFKVEDDLEVTIPEHLHDPELQARMKKVLCPPPATKADELVAPFGGMFYRQEAPGRPPFVEEGQHFEKGQPLYIIEVMKMFNTVRAPFSGTIEKVLMQGADGTVVQKGQPLFKITPDEKFVPVDPKAVERERRTRTQKHLEGVLMTFAEKFTTVEPVRFEEPEEEVAWAGVEAV